jgi:hypothetical protein
MRSNASEQKFEIFVKVAAEPVRGARISWTEVFGAMLILLFASRIAIAEPAAHTPQHAMPIPEGVKLEHPPAQPALEARNALFEIPGLKPFRTAAEIADESIAAAVARGSNPELEPVSAFRKRSRDLFHAERPLEIGEQEMLIRLRLRARARKAMSVEVRF